MSDAKTKMVIEVRDEGDSSKRMEVLGAVSAGEIVEVAVEGLPETRLTLEEANAGLTLRLVAPDAVPPAFGLDRQGPVVIAQTEPGSWTRDTDGRLVAPLNLATVQALALLPPFPPPAPAIPAVRRFPPPPPPPSPYELTAFGARMATALLEYRDSDTAQTLFGAAPMTLLPWPPDGRTADLLDLATGRVYSKAEVDALLAEKATVTALETVRTTANAANSAASAADGKAQTALDGLAGKADLVNGKVPSSQLPSYVDDVLEYASRSAFPATGETGKIYVALDTNKTYRWSGSEYVEISNPDLSGYATKADATLTDVSRLTDWSFNDGLLEAAQEYFGQAGYQEVATDSHLELILYEGSGGVYGIWLVANEGTGRVDFGVCTLSEDGLVAYVTSAMPFVTPYISSDWSIARRMAYGGYKLGSQSDKLLAKALDMAAQKAGLAEQKAVIAAHVPDVVRHVTGEERSAWNRLSESAQATASDTWTWNPRGGVFDTVKFQSGANSATLTISDPSSSDNTPTGKVAMAALNVWDVNSGTPWNIVVDGVTTTVPGGPLHIVAMIQNYTSAGVQKKRTIVLSVTRKTLSGIVPVIRELVAPSTDADAQGKAADAKATGDALAAKQDTISDLAAIRSGAASGASAVQPSGLANYVQKSQTAGLLKNDGTVDTNTYLTQHQDISGKLDANQRNLLAYATTTTLAPETAVYRSSLNSDGTFPTVDATAIPTAAAYYCFELELAVPSTVPSTITGPSGWTWIDGHGLPDPADLSGGETICVSVRLDCTARTFLASVWRVA